jgi:dynein heavy chain 2, cytosolic
VQHTQINTLCCTRDCFHTADDLRHMHIQALVSTVFAYATCSIFNADRLAFGLHLAHRLSRSKERSSGASSGITFEAWDHLLKGGMATGGARAESAPKWLPAAQHGAFSALVQALPSVKAAFNPANDAAWASWLQAPQAGTPLPPCAQQLLHIEQALVVQALRPDRLHSALAGFAAAELAVPSMAPGALSMEALAQEADCGAPVLFLTAPGGDPSHELREHGTRRVPVAPECCQVVTTLQLLLPVDRLSL